MFTLGMATYDDYEGTYFSVQSARIHHPEITEIIILDNNPTSIHGKFNRNLCNWQSPIHLFAYFYRFLLESIYKYMDFHLLMEQQ